jgi:DNA recombination protein RmuC
MDAMTLPQLLLLAAACLAVAGIGAAIWLAKAAGALRTSIEALPALLEQTSEARHRAMLSSLHSGLMQQSDRLGTHLGDSADRLRSAVSQELGRTRDTLQALQLALADSLGQSRQAMTEKLAETAQALNAKIDQRLEQISGKVSERLEEGFRKTNETFLNVMQRLATIDEAQKKIETLTGSVVSLQELLGDKRSRGAFGEVQLEALVRNILPPSAFELQCTLSNGSRADCVLRLPEPTGAVAVDSKFPLENYHRMFAAGLGEAERTVAQRQFRADIRRHVDDIGRKYIIPHETSDGAVMFVPAEAVFAEIHAYHSELVDYAQSRRVWIVSPTTLMAVLNTARAVIKDVETRKQIHIIKEALTRLGGDFRRFDERMKRLADHIRQAHEDAEDVQVSSRKLSQQFARIEAAEIEEQAPADEVRLEVQGGA